MIGVCSECGLEYRWGEVLQPDCFEPRWCIEFEPNGRRLGRAALTTFFRSFWPWGFWRRVRMSHEIRRRRLLAYLVWLLVPLVLLYVFMQSSAAIWLRWQIGRSVDGQAEVDRQVRIYQRVVDGTSPNVFEYLNGLDPETRALEQQRFQAVIDALRAAPAVSGSVGVSYAGAVLEALLLPLSRRSSGMIVDPNGGVGPYPAPIVLWEEAFDASMGGGWGFSWRSGMVRDFGIGSPITLAASLFVMVTFPFALVLLPISRRRAKVRWLHIARVAVYSASIPVFVMVTIGLLLVASLVIVPIDTYAFGAIPWIAFGVFPVLFITWWAVAINRYLSMRHGLSVAVLLTFLCALIVPWIAAIVGEWSGATAPVGLAP